MTLDQVILADILERINRLEDRVLVRPSAQPVPEPITSDLERAGNVVCLPGVTLASVTRSRRSKR